ncbi:MAG: hypothetical protein QOD77_761 [Thermoplasmata archaeon]|jgi:molybdenum cofactor biosynthesis enzyme|nr:hypothetical protein [Thermoplasmata archaeon]
MRLPDVSGQVPTHRMAVARGTLHADVDPARVPAAQAAALLAVKHAATLQPDAVPFQLTDAFCDVAHGTATVTVQGMARTPIGHAALAGVAAALVALAGPAGEGRMELAIVQNVEH